MESDVRLAACDVGSNAIRLVVAKAIGNKERFLQREGRYRVPLRLGDDVFSSGFVSEEKIDGVVQIFKAYRALIDFFKPCRLRACATSALREASNGVVIVERIWRETAIHLEIISGAEEAKALCSNYAGAGLSPETDYLCVDVGGGSTELTFLANGKVIASESFRIGGIRLLRTRVEDSEWERMHRWIDGLPRGIRPIEAIGSGGNISNIYDLVIAASKSEIRRRQIREVVEALEPLSVEQRIRSHRLKPDRADVIVPAGKIYHQVMKWAEIKTMQVPKLGVADGILSQLFEEVYGVPPVRALDQNEH